MNASEFQQHLDAVRAFLTAGDKEQVLATCTTLWSACEEQNCLSNDDVMRAKEYVSRVYAAVVIDTKQEAFVDKAISMLDKAGAYAYSVVLKAKLLELSKRYFEIWDVLCDAYKLQVIDDKISIPQDSEYGNLERSYQAAIQDLLGSCCLFLGLAKAAADCHYQSSLLVDTRDEKIVAYQNYLFCQHYLFGNEIDKFHAHMRFGEFFRDVIPWQHDKASIAERVAKRGKIRIGYYSPDFNKHVMVLFMWALLSKYDRSRFEVVGFCNAGPNVHSWHLSQQTDAWFYVAGLEPSKVAELIRQQEIDILVELAGHTKGNGLAVLAYKPAPIQICGIGYFATTGLPTVDYFLTDKYIVNATTQRYFTERLLILPQSHFSYTTWDDMGEAREAPCVKRGYVTFGSFNNLAKVNDEVLCVWAKILKQVPASRLLLKGTQFEFEAGKEIFWQKLASQGIARERVELRPRTREYMQEYFDMDIALDTFPYPGGGTTCDALYMGVPVVTYGDGSEGGNFGISILQNVGLPELCAKDFDDYIAKAVLLASDFEAINALHLGLRKLLERSAIMDSSLYMSDLEQAYEQIWADYVKQSD